jgi:hypothetical protein
VGLDAYNIARPAVFLIDRAAVIHYSFVASRQNLASGAPGNNGGHRRIAECGKMIAEGRLTIADWPNAARSAFILSISNQKSSINNLIENAYSPRPS